MASTWRTLLVVAWSSACLAAASATPPSTPQTQFQDLFTAVQSARLFGDSKTFADAVPTASAADVLSAYHRADIHGAPQLRDFVAQYFVLPQAVDGPPGEPDSLPIERHIDALWTSLTRTATTAPLYSSLLPLPRPFVVPGGRFRELYYWDSYFTMLGLQSSGRQDLLHDMLQNFVSLLDRYGHVPNGTRSYYLSRSQPPFFFEMVALISPNDPAAAYARYLPQLQREYGYWMRGASRLLAHRAYRHVVRLDGDAVLNRYWDDSDLPRDESYLEDVQLAAASLRPSAQVYRNLRAAAESGWDFSSRWLADGRTLASIDTTDIIPVDLNSLLWGLERAIASGCARAGRADCAAQFTAAAQRRLTAMNRLLWDERAGAFFDYRWPDRHRIERLSAATLYPLFVGLASAAQGRTVANIVQARLLSAGGIETTEIDTGQQWDAPNGWAPLQWVAVDGLRHYALEAVASVIACRWMVDVNQVFERRHALVEKYNVVEVSPGAGGEYPLQDGFGWTNGVMRRLMDLYPAQAHLLRTEDCAALH